MRKTAQLKFFVSFVICYLLFVIFSAPSFAQTTSTSPDSPVLNELFSGTDESVPRDIGGITQVVAVELLGTANCFLIGVNPIAPTRGCLGVNNTTGKLSYQKPNENSGGLVSGLGSMIAMTYTPPASTGTYINYLAENFGVSKKVYAQYENGVGFAGIQPLFGIWKVFRDIAYIIFVGIFVFIGLAIMLRVKIDPRTVMTIENQIPKLIIGIVLVTLSFPIAGLLIDFMYILCYLIINVLASASPELNTQVTKIQAALYEPPIGVVQALWNFPSNVAGVQLTQDNGFGKLIELPAIAVSRIVNNLIDGNLFLRATFLIPTLIFNAPFFYCDLPTNIGPVPLPGLSGLGNSDACQILKDGGFGITGLILPIITLILFFALAWTLFRLWFQLIFAYVLILLDIIFAPFWILGGMLPGEGTFNFGGWIREMASHLLAFPAALTMLLLAKVLTETSLKADGSLFVPPLVGNPGEVNLMGSVVGLGIIFLTPQVVTIMKDILKAPQFKYISAVGQPIAAGQKVAIGGGRESIGLGIESTLGTAKMGEHGPMVIVRKIFGAR